MAGLHNLPTVTSDDDVRHAFARDVSGLELIPDMVARPSSCEEVREVLRAATRDRTPVTPAGAQSSTTGASIVDRGVLLSLRGLSHIGAVDTDTGTITVGAGAILADVRRAAERADLLFTPDPTSEEESTVGGAIACNASGARSLRYGATAPHVLALKVFLASGELLEIRRPALEKNTAGYRMAQDPVDWFVGSEGTLGVVVEAEFALHPLPRHVLGLAIPFPLAEDALAFVVAARRARKLHPRCLEFFDQGAVDIARAASREAGWAHGAGALVYVEETGIDERNDSELPLESWLDLAETYNSATDGIRVYDSPATLQEARDIRHAVPATMNERGAARRRFGGRKISTDWAVPYPRLADALRIAGCLADQAGTPRGITYGHAGNGHPHQNIIANDADEIVRIESVVQATLREVIAMGGTVSAEHGIGKLKQRWLRMQASNTQMRMMKALKHELDPLGLLAPGNVL